MVLVVGAMMTSPALADGGAPPPTNTTFPSSSSTRLPTGTSLVVLDKSGHKLPLGSQQATQAVASGDPVWCPSTLAAPTPGANGCTSPGPGNINYDPSKLDSLVGYLAGHQKAMNGTIWITGGSDGSTGTISLSASTFNVMSLYALTLKGGWNGTSGSATVIPASPSTFGQEILISNWKNNITLSDLQTNAVASGEGLQVTTTKNITLTRVQAGGNSGYGAVLDNSAGTGSVKVTSSHFDNNTTAFDNFGLEIDSHGAITLSSVSANHNRLGASLDNSGGATAYPVVITNSSFNSNTVGNGLIVYSKGAVKLASLFASNNQVGGALINNTFGTGGVTLGGMNVFNSNVGNDGLQVHSNGAITANNLIASSNSNGSGVSLDNCNYNGSVCTTPAAQPVTLTGSNVFSSNKFDGLDVYSLGAISVSSIVAQSNTSGTGAFFENDYTGSAAGVTLTGSGVFLGNFYHGLDVYSHGTINLHQITSETNGTLGANLDNHNASSAKPVYLTGSNVFIGNVGDGLDIYSKGAIVLNNIVAISNTNGDGVHLYNHYAGVTSGVTLTGSSAFIGNALDGLEVYTNGAVSANNLTAICNGYSDNCITPLSSIGVFIDNSGGTGNVTLSGANTFEDNSSNGLWIYSKGVITVSNLTVKGNDTSLATSTPGARLDDSLGSGGVTLTGTNIFSGNHDAGLNVVTRGAVLLYNIVAYANTGYGAQVENSSSGLAPGVTLAGTSEFKFNAGDGLDVLSKGAISVHNVSANSNIGYGASLDNTLSGTAAPANVVVSGVNAFDANFLTGLSVQSYGAIAASNLTADNNGISSTDNGVTLDNCNFDLILLTCDTVTAKSVNLTGTNFFNGNDGRGLSIQSKGAITVHSVTANGNVYSDGTQLHSYGGASVPVTVSGTNVFSGNGGRGLNIIAGGPVVVNKTTADQNSLNGLNVTSTGGKITVDCGSFLYNTGNGVNLTAPGAITLISVFTYGNATDIVTSHSYTSVLTCPLP